MNQLSSQHQWKYMGRLSQISQIQKKAYFVDDITVNTVHLSSEVIRKICLPFVQTCNPYSSSTIHQGRIELIQVLDSTIIISPQNNCIIVNSISIFTHRHLFLLVDNAIPIKSWFNDPSDTALLNLLPVLDALRFVSDVRSVLSRNREAHRNW